MTRETQRGRVFALRFPAYGSRQYVTLGTAAEGWNRPKAEDELANVLADVRRGIWTPSAPPVGEAPPDPTFHEFASEWFEQNRHGWGDRTQENYLWQLRSHLLPFFGRHQLSAITVAEVDRYRAAKLGKGKLNPGQINKTLVRLGQVLDVAVERELIARNPLRINPRNRKLKVPKRRPVYLDSAEQIVAVLDAASELDGRKTARTQGRRGFMATLVFAGLRITEACQLQRRDVDVANGRITVRDSKTAAGVREVDLLPVLRDELATHLATHKTDDPYGFVFPTARGTARNKDNARARVIKPVIARANELALERTGRPLPDHVTAHKLRHTFASLMLAHDPDPTNAMTQMGHTDPAFTIRVYTHLMRRSPEERARLTALIEGVVWAPIGTSEGETERHLDPREMSESPHPA